MCVSWGKTFWCLQEDSTDSEAEADMPRRGASSEQLKLERL